jgi:2-amino-4-hydroxy-6-hydroxymethyldihydropteridine diphosphokinase
MSIVYLALGTNLDDRRANLQNAIIALPPALTALESSFIYETLPWGVMDQPAFLNMAVRGETKLKPRELLTQIKHLEKQLGRQPSIRYGPRKIDLDLLFYDDLVLHTSELIIPHPGLQQRAFVLVPLADLAPEFIHPVSGKTVRQMLAEVSTEGVKRYG